ncbi:MAG: DUF4349 domain-containing protein [Candidatus Pacebacteria bacterium]|nr:DUF4349 domain-containing protein [Candidatus Paceibacterota bacterium]
MNTNIKKQIIKFIKKYTKSAIAVAAILSIVIILFLFAIIGTISQFANNSNVSNNTKSWEGSFLNQEVMMDSVSGGNVNYSRSEKMMVMPSPESINEEMGEYDESAERKVIKTGSLSLIVEDIESSRKVIVAIANEFEGFVQRANFSKGNHNVYYENGIQKKSLMKSGYLDLKIPTKNFEQALEKIKVVAIDVENENVSASDVTEQYSDLETQIKNKKAEEDQYRAILKRSGEIKDVLEVTKYMNKARSDRERLQGRLNVLSNQVKLSSVRVNLISKKDVEIFGIKWSPIYDIKLGFKGLLDDAKELYHILWAFVFKLPIYLVWVVIFVFGFKFGILGWKKVKGKVWGKKKK